MLHRFSQHVFLVSALKLAWLVVIFFGELGVFLWSLFECKWPAVLHETSKVRGMRVLLVADTQVQHRAVLSSQSWWSHPFRRIPFELNMRKSWHITSYLRPDAVVFLGDMLSNGKAAKSHQEYKSAADKFKSVFRITDPRTEVHYIPGNNDVGLGLDRSTSRTLRSFYQEFFGDLNHKFVLKNHTFIAINSAGLVDEDYLRNGEHIPFQSWLPLHAGTVSFVKQVAHQRPLDPVILLTHIPLARSETAHCGPLREYGTIHLGAGPGWQSTLSKQSTSFLLETLRPSIIFSADNRDYCEYTHSILHPDSPRGLAGQRYHVREITLKSFSMSVHIRRPGFQLLTLVDPASLAPTQQGVASHSPPSLAERACFLPDQFKIYNHLYAPLFVLSVLILARFHFLKPKKGFRTKAPFLAVNTGLAIRSSVDRDLLLESPSSLIRPASPRAEPFSPVRPQAQTLGLANSTCRESSVSSFSSTTTLLGGENGKDVDCDLNVEVDKPDLMTDTPAMSKAEKGSFSFTSVSRQWEQSSNFGSRHPYVRQPSAVDMEFFQDKEVVDEEAPEPVYVGPEESVMESPPETRHLHWSTSYSFVFRGRSRMIRLELPSRSALWNLMEFIGVGWPWRRKKTHSLTQRRGVRGCIVDVVDVCWPGILLWLVVNGVSMLL